MQFNCSHVGERSVVCSLTPAAAWILYFRGGCGYGSESEGEEPADSRVTLPQNVPGRGNTKAQQSAIRLTEVWKGRETCPLFNLCARTWNISYHTAIICSVDRSRLCPPPYERPYNFTTLRT